MSLFQKIDPGQGFLSEPRELDTAAEKETATSFDVELSDEQQLAVFKIAERVHFGEKVQTLGGYAGTGKTTCIRALKACHPDMVVCSFTGKAANILRRKGIDDASTIHSLIYQPRKNAKGETVFELRAFPPFGARGFIIDESSMVGETIYKDLLSFGLPCVFVGDHGQLEPIEQGFNLMAKPDYTLETIHRHAGEIPRFAEWLRVGKPARDFRSESGAVTLLRNGEVKPSQAMSVDQMIVGFNRTRCEFNDKARAALGRTGIVEVGERVMCLRNDRDEGIFNGMQGTVTEVESHDGRLRIDFDTFDGLHPHLEVDAGQFGKKKGPGKDCPRCIHYFDYAYAITAHKSQGDEWPSVMVFEQECPHWEHKRWAYTAASRAQQQLFWVLEKGGRRGRSRS
jgi:exodeoxyribonuclease-5